MQFTVSILYETCAELTYFFLQQSVEEGKILKGLSIHEQSILKLISRQKTSAEIATMLFINPKPVSNHRSNISKKLGLSGEQSGLLKWALEHKKWL